MATDFEIAVMAQLGELKTIAATAAANTEALNARLFNGGSGVIHELQKDIQEIKDSRESEAKWTRLHNVLHYSIGPLLVLGHEIAKKMGIAI